MLWNAVERPQLDRFSTFSQEKRRDKSIFPLPYSRFRDILSGKKWRKMEQTGKTPSILADNTTVEIERRVSGRVLHEVF
jgi:hypothetical protein